MLQVPGLTLLILPVLVLLPGIDVGLRNSVNRLYGGGRRLSDRRTLAITRPWAPYRSVASWYLWRLGNEEPANWA